MNKIGLCSVTFREKTISDILEWMGTTPLQAIEWAGDIHVNPEESLKYKEEVAKQSAASQISISSYGSYYHAGESEDFHSVLDTAKALGTKDIRIWAGKMDFNKNTGEINPEKQQQIISDIKEVAQKAAKEDMKLHLEFHRWTYTDTAEDTVYLLEQIDEPNVYTYWQPEVDATMEHRLNDIHTLGPWISNVHVFNWDNESQRYPLEDGRSKWAQYIEALEQYPYANRHYLMEFVVDDDMKQASKDAQVLKELLEEQ